MLTDTDLRAIAKAVMAYTDAGDESFHDRFFGEIVPNVQAALAGIATLNAKIGAISAVDPAAVAAALAANPQFTQALAAAIAASVPTAQENATAVLDAEAARLKA